MSDEVLAILFVALCADIFAWILVFRAISRRLRERHAPSHAAVSGAGTRRKNGMDQFFSLLTFLVNKDYASLEDRALTLRCLLLKIATLLFFLIFIAMMFGPFFLRLK
jgi:hypothetical protein